MSEVKALRAVRQWLNDSRAVHLAGFLVVNDAIRELEAKSKQRLAAVLRSTDEFRNVEATAEEYRPS